MILNRSTSISKLDYSTPFCVFQEIMKCLGEDIELPDVEGNLDMIMQYIDDTKPEVELDGDLTKIAMYTSQAQTNWDNDKLQVAFNHIVNILVKYTKYNDKPKAISQPILPMDPKQTRIHTVMIQLCCIFIV